MSEFRKAGTELARHLIENWRSVIPRDQKGQPMGHAGPVGVLTNFVNSGDLSGRDRTGGVSIGASGLRINRMDENGGPGWSMSVNPRSRSAEFNRGDFGFGGSWAQDNPSGYLRMGPVRVSGGYGAAPTGAAASLTGFGAPSGWGKAEFEFGSPSRPVSELDAVGRLDQAVAPWATKTEQESQPSARDELEAQLAERRRRDPNWWRP